MAILVMTFLFIIATSPGAIISQFYSVLVRSETGLVILLAGDDITFSYHAFTFIILYFTNKEFLRRIKVNNAPQITNMSTIQLKS